jgi:hypothetical protein
MPVQLQSDLIVSAFWRDVQRHLSALLNERGLSVWAVILRPKTKADAEFTPDPERYGLTPREARQSDQSNWSSKIDDAERTCEFSFPGGGEQWLDPDDGHVLSPPELAAELADDLELLTDL